MSIRLDGPVTNLGSLSLPFDMTSTTTRSDLFHTMSASDAKSTFLNPGSLTSSVASTPCSDVSSTEQIWDILQDTNSPFAPTYGFDKNGNIQQVSEFHLFEHDDSTWMNTDNHSQPGSPSSLGPYNEDVFAESMAEDCFQSCPNTPFTPPSFTQYEEPRINSIQLQKSPENTNQARFSTKHRTQTPSLSHTEALRLRAIAMPQLCQSHCSSRAVSPTSLCSTPTTSSESRSSSPEQYEYSSRKRKLSSPVDSPYPSSPMSANSDASSPKRQKSARCKTPLRSAHNITEKRYRANVNDKLTRLRDAVPFLRSEAEERAMSRVGEGYPKRLNKATILSRATEYIRHLELRLENVKVRDFAYEKGGVWNEDYV